jgi:hypothetical protein
MALTDNLIAFWELADTQDAHTNNYDLTNINSATFAAGKVGNGVDLERDSSQSMIISDANGPLLSPANTSFTMAFWFKMETDPATTMFFAEKATGSSIEYWVGYQGGTPNTKFSAFGSVSGGNEIFAERSGALSAGAWYLVFAWFDASDDKVHLQVTNDSSYESTVNDSSGTLTGGIFETSGDFTISGDPAGFFGGRFLDGIIDQFGVWGRALTADERLQLWNGGSGMSYAQIAAAGSVSWLPVAHVVQGPSQFFVAAGMTPPDKV